MKPQPMALSLTFGVSPASLRWSPAIRLCGFLRRRGLGKKVRIEGPSSHIEKTGTPTMGGLLICGTVLLLTAVLTFTFYSTVGRSILLPLFVLVSCAVLGAIDDRMTIQGVGQRRACRRGPSSAGCSRSAPSRRSCCGIRRCSGIDFIFLPTVKSRSACRPGPVHPAGGGRPIVGTANAVNLTDGLDSLAGRTAFVAFAAYGMIAYLYGQFYLVTFCFTVAGALPAFLWFNAHPAEVFMGDTGSLALGATLAVVALMLGQVLLLPIIGFVFVAEALSVILQVGYFKLTRGKRLFRMAPLHHHFELMGWSETQVAQRFWLVSILAAMLGVALALV